MSPMTVSALVKVRLAVIEEIARLRRQADALQIVLDAVEGILGEPPGEMPPARPVGISPAKPAPATRPSAPAVRQAKYDWEEVAQVCEAALAAGKPQSRAIVERYAVKAAMASWMVQQAHKRGLMSPPEQRPVAAVGPAVSASPDSNGEAVAVEHADGLITSAPLSAEVLVCESCDFQVDAELPTRRMAMASHVRRDHGRHLLASESVPEPRGAA